jgi:hypothetical protein
MIDRARTASLFIGLTVCMFDTPALADDGNALLPDWLARISQT